MRNKKRIRKEVDRYRKERGTVILFVTIILVPCIVVASLFVDVSRVQYSKMEASSAADLALDATLSRYDLMLNDYYGFVASCQSADEYLQKSQEYFAGMMRAEGNDTGAAIFTEFIKDYQNGTVADFLKTDILESVVVEPVANSSLEENPALIEDGIVEFMKYRGLVPLGKRLKDLADRITNMKGFDNLSDADGNKDIAKAKEKYGEEESKLLKDAFHTYLAIRLYENAQKDTNFPSADEYREISTTLKGFRDDLYKVTEIITLYYAGTDGIDYVQFPTIGKNTYTSDPAYKRESIGTGYDINGSTVYYLYNSQYEEILEKINGENSELADYENAIKEAAERIANACSEIHYNNGTTNPAMWCYKIQQAVSADDLEIIRSNADNMMRLYAFLEGALNCEADSEAPEDEALPDQWQEDLKYAQKTIDRIWSDYLRDGSFEHGQGSYNELRKDYKYVANDLDTISKVWNRSYTFDSSIGNGVTISDFASAVTSYLDTKINIINERIEHLNKPIDGGQITWNSDEHYDVVSIDTLLEDVRHKENALDEWEKKADENPDSQYVQEVDKPEINKIRANVSNKEIVDNKLSGDDIEELSHDFERRVDESSVNELKMRLEHIRDDLQKCKDSIEEFTYGGQKVRELYDVNAYINAGVNGGIDKEQIGLSLTDGANKAQEFSKSLINPSEGDVFEFNITSFDMNSDGHNPEIGNPIPRLYKYMKDQFQDKEGEIGKNTEKAEGKMDEFKEMMKSASDAAKIGEMDEIAKEECGKDVIEDISTQNTGNIVTVITSFVKYVNDIINGDGGLVLGDARDKVYVTEYVMDMLTYATTNNEGRYKQNKSATIKDYQQRYNVTDWGTTDAQHNMEDQSLTNKCFNLENNKALLGEVEYVLYGKPTVQENAAEAYKRIFALREVLDITSGFILFWGLKTNTGRAINGTATAIASATAGCVPTVLSKTIMIMAIATIEAAKDLEYLKKGVGVTFYKTSEDDWLCALSGDNWEEAGVDKNGIGKSQPEDREGMYYSDYLYIFFLVATFDDAAYSNMLLRIGDMVENNMGLHKSGFDLKNSYCYYHLKADMQVKPLMLSMPIIDTYTKVDIPTFRSNSVWCKYKIDVVRGYS